MKNIEIKTVAYVRIGGKLVDTRDLTDEQRPIVATGLKNTYLNALFQGLAVFYPKEEKEKQHGQTAQSGDRLVSEQ